MTGIKLSVGLLETLAAIAWDEYRAASRVLSAFPRLANGLTPDTVKATHEYRAAKARADAKFQALRAINARLARARKEKGGGLTLTR